MRFKEQKSIFTGLQRLNNIRQQHSDDFSKLVGNSRSRKFPQEFTWFFSFCCLQHLDFKKATHACAFCFWLGFSCSFTSDTSPKWIDREGLGKRRTGTRQIYLEDGAVSHRFDGMLPGQYTVYFLFDSSCRRPPPGSDHFVVHQRWSLMRELTLLFHCKVLNILTLFSWSVRV